MSLWRSIARLIVYRWYPLEFQIIYVLRYVVLNLILPLSLLIFLVCKFKCCNLLCWMKCSEVYAMGFWQIVTGILSLFDWLLSENFIEISHFEIVLYFIFNLFLDRVWLPPLLETSWILLQALTYGESKDLVLDICHDSFCRFFLFTSFFCCFVKLWVYLCNWEMYPSFYFLIAELLVCFCRWNMLHVN